MLKKIELLFELIYYIHCQNNHIYVHSIYGTMDIQIQFNYQVLNQQF